VPSQKNDIISQLQKSILPLQGFKPPAGNTVDVGLGQVEEAFPNTSFPTGAMHEFLSTSPEGGAATGGFIAGLLASLMASKGACVWIGPARTLFPPALKAFGIEPERVIFASLQKERDALWAMEEALKCEGLAAVVGEIKEIGFTASRRLQLAVEQSRVTGFILRNQPRSLTPIACVARWKITSLPSELEDGLPGVGFPRWNVELLKVRNGKPGTWEVEWCANGFRVITQEKQTIWLNASSQYGSAI
jgi:protein ImuA